MKMTRLLVVAAGCLLLVPLAIIADEAKTEVAAETPVELKNQTVCPVMGGPIDSTAFTDIQGQRVYHCCPGCTAALEKDPDKFFKKAAADGILFENIQTTCPVSGSELADKDTHIDFEGRRVFFCCPGCIGPFKEDPAKYLAALDAPAKADDEGKMKMKMKAHDGH